MESGRSCGRSQKQQRVMNGWVVHCYRTSRYFLATDFAALTGNPEDPTSSLSWNVSVFWSYEKVFQNSCRQESKKAPLTEGINPRKVYTLSWTLSWGCFFFWPRWFLVQRRRDTWWWQCRCFFPWEMADGLITKRCARWYTHLTKLRFRV